MLLPDKHITLSESLFGLAALVLTYLDQRRGFDQLMAVLTPQFATPDWPAYHNTETVSLALCFLHAAGLVDVSQEGDLYRCA